MGKRYYRPELDALRFFAFVCVFCCHQRTHTRWIERLKDAGAFGMCIFFMLSAYLIVTILLREKDETATVNWKSFAVRRILRIWPLYFAVLFLTYGLGHFWPPAHIPGHAVFAFSILLGNAYVISHGWILGVANPLWSLSVEEQFYVAVPMMARLCGRRSLATIFIATIAVAYVVLIWLGHRRAIANPGVWTNSFVQFQFFAAGGLVALYFYSIRFVLPIWARCAIATCGLGLWIIASFAFDLQGLSSLTPRQLVCGYALAMLGTLMIFLSVIDLDIRIPHPLVYLGKISYGLYVFHEFFIELAYDTHYRWPRMINIPTHPLVTIPLVFAATVGTAALSYHFFERPILKFKERFETIRTRLA